MEKFIILMVTLTITLMPSIGRCDDIRTILDKYHIGMSLQEVQTVTNIWYENGLESNPFTAEKIIFAKSQWNIFFDFGRTYDIKNHTFSHRNYLKDIWIENIENVDVNILIHELKKYNFYHLTTITSDTFYEQKNGTQEKQIDKNITQAIDHNKCKHVISIYIKPQKQLTTTIGNKATKYKDVYDILNRYPNKEWVIKIYRYKNSCTIHFYDAQRALQALEHNVNVVQGSRGKE